MAYQTCLVPGQIQVRGFDKERDRWSLIVENDKDKIAGFLRKRFEEYGPIISVELRDGEDFARIQFGAGNSTENAREAIEYEHKKILKVVSRNHESTSFIFHVSQAYDNLPSRAPHPSSNRPPFTQPPPHIAPFFSPELTYPSAPHVGAPSLLGPPPPRLLQHILPPPAQHIAPPPAQHMPLAQYIPPAQHMPPAHHMPPAQHMPPQVVYSQPPPPQHQAPAFSTTIPPLIPEHAQPTSPAQPVVEVEAEVPSEDVNDIEIVVYNPSCREYAEKFHHELSNKMDLRVEVLYPKPNIPTQTIIDNISSRGVQSVVSLDTDNMNKHTINIRVLRGPFQKIYKNLPQAEAFLLITKIYNCRVKTKKDRERESKVADRMELSAKNGKQRKEERRKKINQRNERKLEAAKAKESEKIPKDILTIVDFILSERPLSILEYDKTIKYLVKARQQALSKESDGIIPEDLLLPPVGPNQDPELKSMKEELTDFMMELFIPPQAVPLDANLNAAIENLLTAGPNLLANLRPDPGLQPQNSQRILADLDLDLTTLLAMDINTKDLFSRRPQDDKKRSRSPGIEVLGKRRRSPSPRRRRRSRERQRRSPPREDKKRPMSPVRDLFVQRKTAATNPADVLGSLVSYPSSSKYSGDTAPNINQENSENTNFGPPPPDTNVGTKGPALEKTGPPQRKPRELGKSRFGPELTANTGKPAGKKGKKSRKGVMAEPAAAMMIGGVEFPTSFGGKPTGNRNRGASFISSASASTVPGNGGNALSRPMGTQKQQFSVNPQMGTQKQQFSVNPLMGTQTQQLFFNPNENQGNIYNPSASAQSENSMLFPAAASCYPSRPENNLNFNNFNSGGGMEFLPFNQSYHAETGSEPIFMSANTGSKSWSSKKAAF